MVLLSAALLALSMHVLPAVAVAIAAPFAFPQTTSTSQCTSNAGCVTFENALTTCNINGADPNINLTDAQTLCLCKTSGFAAAAASCLTCLGTTTTQTTMENLCAAVASSQPASTVIASKTTTSAKTATRTTASTSQSASLTPSESACAKTQQCIFMSNDFGTCHVNLTQGNPTDSDMKCLCNQSGFLDNLIACERCLGLDTTSDSTACDGYVSSAISTITMPTLTPTPTPTPHTPVSTGGIVGIGIGAVASIAIVAIAVAVYLRQRKPKVPNEGEKNAAVVAGGDNGIWGARAHELDTVAHGPHTVAHELDT